MARKRRTKYQQTELPTILKPDIKPYTYHTSIFRTFNHQIRHATFLRIFKVSIVVFEKVIKSSSKPCEDS